MLFPLPAARATPQRVAVTGAGIVTALGVGWHPNAEGFRAGRTAFRRVTRFDVSRHRAQRAAEVDLPPAWPQLRASRRHLERLEHGGRMLLLAAHEAWQQSGWQPSENLPVVVGTSGGGMALGEEYFARALAHPADRRGQPTRTAAYQPQRAAVAVGEALGFVGPVLTLTNACASGANALGHAWEILRQGRAHRILAGGFDALARILFSGFDSLQALSTTSCRPFDAGRDGLMLGEGAAVLALETLAEAQRRGATILGEILGYGATTDIHHLTQPQPEGEAARASMQAACASAGVSPEEIDYLNAHGTGTALNDSAEATAICRWAGAAVSRIPVSSTKAGVGHLLGGAGAVEAVVCLMALQGQWLPPETVIETPDPLCRFPLVRTPQDARVDVAMSNSFGFGGANATLIFRRAP